MTVVITSKSPADGIPPHGEIAGEVPASTRPTLETALEELQGRKDEWPRVGIADRRAIVKELIMDFASVAGRWAEACRDAEGIPANTPSAGEEWLAGPYLVLRNLRLLDQSLAEIERYGQPRIPGPVCTRPDGQVTARVFPQDAYDRIFYSGLTAEVWMEPGVTAESLAATQAVAYRDPGAAGAVSLVLGAGNVSSIAPMDLLYKIFVENKTVILKMHPVNAYLGPILADGFRALCDWGVLRIVYGGADVGAYLTENPGVDEIHITGSDKTVETIVFGTGEEGRLRKEKRQPKLEKPVTSELGNVSAVIVVPGPWSESDVAYQAESLVSMLTNNAGFNCNATRVIVQHEGWKHRDALLHGVRERLHQVTPRKAYYPGARDRFTAFVDAHADAAERFGKPADGELPWALIPGLDAQAEDDICFHTEAFCGVFSETGLAAEAVPEFLARAVEFANERLWGNLNVTLLAHPASLKDPDVREAFDRAVADLRFGTVSINNWAAVGYGLVSPPWGAYPGNNLEDIQSGSGWVHNTLMFDRPQKTVVRSPFRMTPKPVWFPSHKTAHRMAKKITEFEAAPSALKLPGIFWEALRG